MEFVLSCHGVCMRKCCVVRRSWKIELMSQGAQNIIPPTRSTRNCSRKIPGDPYQKLHCHGIVNDEMVERPCGQV